MGKLHRERRRGGSHTFLESALAVGPAKCCVVEFNRAEAIVVDLTGQPARLGCSRQVELR